MSEGNKDLGDMADDALDGAKKSAENISDKAGDALDSATEKFLLNDKSPSRKVGELDTRGSHFYLTMYWAEALSEQTNDNELKTIFEKISSEIKAEEQQILKELSDTQGNNQNIGGYYIPDADLVSKRMNSCCWNLSCCSSLICSISYLLLRSF